MSEPRGAETDTLPLPGSEPPGRGPLRLHGLEFDIAAFSERGPRPENQDAYAVDTFSTAGLVAVADGMGGERGGRIAADIALRALLDAAPVRSVDDARRAARAADRAVAAAAEQDAAGRHGMGCALGLLALHATISDGAAWIAAHVGDVRILSRSADGTVRLETRDHTPAFARWEAGEIELDAVPEAEGANRLQRAVGRGGEADTARIPARPGWAYAIISDGVTKAMRLDELGEALAAPTAAAACETIRHKVEERGADDNFTAAVVRIGGQAEAASGTAPTAPSTSRSAPVRAPRRSVGSVLIGVLALLALLASGIAVWAAHETRERAATEAGETLRLRQQLDSLRLRLDRLEAEQPFGPAGPP